MLHSSMLIFVLASTGQYVKCSAGKLLALTTVFEASPVFRLKNKKMAKTSKICVYNG